MTRTLPLYNDRHCQTKRSSSSLYFVLCPQKVVSSIFHYFGHWAMYTVRIGLKIIQSDSIEECTFEFRRWLGLMAFIRPLRLSIKPDQPIQWHRISAAMVMAQANGIHSINHINCNWSICSIDFKSVTSFHIHQPCDWSPAESCHATLTWCMHVRNMSVGSLLVACYLRGSLLLSVSSNFN